MKQNASEGAMIQRRQDRPEARGGRWEGVEGREEREKGQRGGGTQEDSTK